MVKDLDLIFLTRPKTVKYDKGRARDGVAKSGFYAENNGRKETKAYNYALTGQRWKTIILA